MILRDNLRSSIKYVAQFCGDLRRLASTRSSTYTHNGISILFRVRGRNFGDLFSDVLEVSGMNHSARTSINLPGVRNGHLIERYASTHLTSSFH